MHQHITSKTKKGFTLLETLVAISVLLFVIIGPMTIAQKGVQNAYFANEQLTAIFLAQEAIEAVRELRDAEALDVYTGIDTETSDWVPAGCGTECAYDVVNNRFESCSEGCVLKVDTNGNYNYEPGGTLSPFARKITIGAVVGGGVLVSVDVSWATQILGGATKHVTLQTWIYDHYQRFEN